jgi:putative membrane protein
VQILVFFVTRTVFSSLAHDIENDRIPSGIMLAVFSLAAGILNAACMTY